MSSNDEKKIKRLIHKLGLKYKLLDEDIKNIIESPYEFSAKIIKGLDLDSLNNEEELNNIKTNFMYTGFAKFYVNPFAFNKRIEKNKLKTKEE